LEKIKNNHCFALPARYLYAEEIEPVKAKDKVELGIEKFWKGVLSVYNTVSIPI